MENQNEIEFDLLQMLRYLLKRIWIILLAMVVFAVAGYVISKKTTVPQYTASCRAYVYDDSSTIPYNNALYSMYIAKDCQFMLTGQNVSEKVVEELGLSISPDTISSKLKVSAEEDTHFIEIKYTDTNPKRAAAILNKVCEVGKGEIEEHMQVDAFSIVYEAKVPTAPTAGTTTRDTILGAAVGMVLAAAVLIVLFLMDDTIRSEDDVERYLGLSTLSAVTLSVDLATDGKIVDNTKKKGAARTTKK